MSAVHDDLAYHKVEKYIEKLLTGGALKAGDRLLSERKMGQMFGVSSDSARKGLARFIEEGILIKRPGKGTFVARTIRKKNATNRIGVVFAHSMAGFFASSFYAGIMSGIAEELHVEKKNMVLRSFADTENNDFRRAFTDVEGDVDGFVVVDLLPTGLEQMRETIVGMPKPVVVVNYENPPAGVDAVVTDSAVNVRTMLERMVGDGHRNIICMFESQGGGLHPNPVYRVNAYKAYVQEREMPVHLLDLDTGRDRLSGLLTEFMSLPDKPTAVLATGSYLVFQWLYPAARKAGIRIPGDLAVLAYDNVSECLSSTPQIASLDTPVSELGRQGAKLLVNRLKEGRPGREQGHYRIVLTGNVLERESYRSLT